MDPNNGGDQNSGSIAPPRGYAMSGKIMLSAIVILFTVVLLILFLHLYVRFHVNRRASRRARRRRLVFAGEGQNSPTAAARGLDPEVVKSLSVLIFSAADDGEGDNVTECAVCLNEFEEGEKVRSLPRCGHRFHIECIDMWFHSHGTCPLCRSAVEAEAPPPAADSVEIPVDLEAQPPVECSSASDLCSSCRREEAIGSSSSNSGEGELRIEVPARRGEGFRGLEEEQGLGSTSGFGFKSSGNRILTLKRLLSRDLRIYRSGASGAEPDLERVESAERAPPPPLPRVAQ